MTLPTTVLTHLLQNSSLPCCTLNKDGIILKTNTVFKESFSLNNDSTEQIKIFELLYEGEIDSFMSHLNAVNEKSPVHQGTFKFKGYAYQKYITLEIDFILDDKEIFILGNSEKDKERNLLPFASNVSKTGVFEINALTKEIFLSSECYNILDLPQGVPITEDRLINFYKPAFRAVVQEIVSTCLTQKSSFDSVYSILTAKDHQKWISILGEPIIENNQVVYVRGSLSDCTARYRKEEINALALKGMQSGVFNFNVRKKVIHYSNGFKAMLGIPDHINSATEQEYVQMIHPDDAEGASARHRDSIQQDENHYFNYYRLQQPDGSYRHYEVYGYRKKNKKGKATQLVGNLIDVHQNRMKEETLIHSRQRLKAMVNHTFAYTILLDTKGVIMMCDDHTQENIKRDFGIDVMTTPSQFVDVMALNFKHSFAHDFNSALKGEETRNEIEQMTSDGKSQWLETKYTPIIGSNNKISSVLVSFHDITELKQAELSIKEAHQREQELSTLKANILSNFSHEIRTPLNGIITISKLLADEEDDDEKEGLIQYLDVSNKRLLKTIDSLSRLSELENANVNMNPKVIDLNYTVETSFREFDHIAKGKNLSYELVLDESSPQVKIDEKFFKPAIDNLIHNAIKYTEHGKVIISIYTSTVQNNVYISVKDTGIGIHSDYLTKIFEPFIQESLGLSRKYEGTGIGLSVSKRYIEILGGKLEVNSKTNQGTEFLITIPKHS